MDGFVDSQSGPVSMGYITPETLPFVNSLAATFPVCDRWFCSVGAQTYPNRRFLMAGTSLGLTRRRPERRRPAQRHHLPGPRRPRHLVEELLLDAAVRADLVVPGALPGFSSHLSKTDQFFADAAAGHAPVGQPGRPELRHDVRGGSPGRPVRRPVPVQGGQRRDGTRPSGPTPCWCGPTTSGAATTTTSSRRRRPSPDDGATGPRCPGDPPGSFDRYGFRVPSGIVSPYARKDYVSHVVHDHTSVLKLIETKWNLPALTHRDGGGRRPARQRRPARPHRPSSTPPKLAAAARPAVLGPGA